MLISPIAFVKIGAWLSRGRGMTRWNDPQEVSRSFSMRLQYRIAGAFVTLLGSIQSYNEIVNLLNKREGSFGGIMLAFIVAWLAMGIGFVISPSHTLRLLRWSRSEVLPKRDVAWLRALGALSVGFGVWFYLHVI